VHVAELQTYGDNLDILRRYVQDHRRHFAWAPAAMNSNGLRVFAAMFRKRSTSGSAIATRWVGYL
jgi:hypothetical protein